MRFARTAGVATGSRRYHAAVLFRRVRMRQSISRSRIIVCVSWALAVGLVLDVRASSGQVRLGAVGAGTSTRVRATKPMGYPPIDNGFDAYYPAFTGGVRVAAGDVNGDGMPDIVTAPGPGSAPIVRVFDGASHALIREFMGAEPSFTGGLFVAVDDDGFADIIVGLDAGREPLVRVFSGWSGAVIRRFLAYASGFRGGVHVAAGDMNGDGYADIICGAGPGGGPHVVAFNAVDLSVLASFYAYAPTFTGGVWVAAGDVDGDGLADIVTGAGAGGAPEVRVVSGKTGAQLVRFSLYDRTFTGGVRVAAADVGTECDGCWSERDGLADILTAPGAGAAPDVII